MYINMSSIEQDLIQIIDLSDYPNKIPYDLLIILFNQYIKNIDCLEKVVLIMLNKILQQCNMNKIEKINDFMIDRRNLVKIDGLQFINNYKFILERFFDYNKDFKYYARNFRKKFIISIMNGFADKLNLKFTRYQKNVYINKELSYQTFYFFK